MKIICNDIDNYAKRFWEKVDIKEDGECWEWKRCVQSKGYGSVSIGKSRTAGAHRVAYQLSNGEFPEDLCVLHKCDNRRCCNPSHLFLGTIQDNNRDMCLKGRQARGEKSGRAKLTMSDVTKMRALYSKGNITYSGIAIEFKISPTYARSVIKGDYWNLPLAE